MTQLVLGQTRKIEVYFNKEGQEYTQRQKDSIWYKANQYVATRKLRETSDSAFFQLTYFDKTLVPSRYEKDGNYCGNPKRDKKKIQNLFPYNNFDKIKLVSFKLPHPDSVERRIPLTNGQVDMTGMFESVTLEKELSEKLVDILFNYDNPEDERLVFMCYDPRNAIIFMDKSDKIIGFIELCFDCLDFKAEPKNMVMGSFCTEKFDAIQGIFMAAGLKYGMKRDMD